MENLIHEASHGNWHRSSRKLNDRMANWLCAYWLLLNVALYRAPHRDHHNHFGTARDPDKQRYERLQLDQLSRTAPGRFFLSMMRLMPTYVCGYWAQFVGQAQARQLGLSLGLHGLVVALGSSLAGQCWLCWLLYFWVPFLLYLPVHRFLAEAEEHHYEKARSIFEATLSNLGLVHRWFLHPHGDGYHLLHHMLESIPHWRMGCVHTLMCQDEAYQAGMVRTSMIEEPHEEHIFQCVHTITVDGAQGGDPERR